MEVIYSVKLGLRSLNSGKMISQIINATNGFNILEQSDIRKSDLLIFELGQNPAEDLRMLTALVEDGDCGEIFLTSDSTDSTLLMQAMRIGVKEFFTQPINEEEVKQALGRFKQRKSRPNHIQGHKDGKIITVFGSKGGVGTTTVAVNLSVALMNTPDKPSVALLDMNTLFGEIPLFLEISPKFNWGEITKNIDRLDETFLSNILSEHRTGVKVLPSPAYLNGHIKPSAETMSRILMLMKRLFDWVIVDGGQSTEDASLKVLEISDILFLITILSLPCLANTNKLLKSFTDLGYIQNERIRVLLNRYMKKGDISQRDAEAGIGKQIYWKIPNDYATTMAAINNGKSLNEIAPRAQISKSFIDLADALSSQPESGFRKKWGGFINKQTTKK
jgi:pilus assembly protein CpaE